MEYLRSLAITADNRDEVLRQLMIHYSTDVWNYAYVLTRKKDMADDIAQEVFLNAYRRLLQFEGRSSPRTWLLAITRNVSLNALQSSFVRRVLTLGLNPSHSSSRSSSRSAELEAVERDSIRRIWGHVLCLPSKLRETLLLDAHYRMPHREIAELLGISEGTVRSRLHRARAKIEQALEVDAR